MLRTYDFALMAQKDEVLLRKIENALLNSADEVIYTDMHKLSFMASKELLLVEARSENSPVHHKIVPKMIKYSAVRKMLNGSWEDISEGEILDVEW